MLKDHITSKKRALEYSLKAIEVTKKNLTSKSMSPYDSDAGRIVKDNDYMETKDTLNDIDTHVSTKKMFDDSKRIWNHNETLAHALTTSIDQYLQIKHSRCKQFEVAPNPLRYANVNPVEQ